MTITLMAGDNARRAKGFTAESACVLIKEACAPDCEMGMDEVVQVDADTGSKTKDPVRRSANKRESVFFIVLRLNSIFWSVVGRICEAIVAWRERLCSG